jgi:hypothetical protein
MWERHTENVMDQTCTSQCQFNFLCTCTYDHLLSVGPKDRTPSGPRICGSIDCDETNNFIIECSPWWIPMDEPQIYDKIRNFIIESSPGLKPKQANPISAMICENVTLKTPWINQFVVVIMAPPSPSPLPRLSGRLLSWPWRVLSQPWQDISY